eukprot:1940396-Pyramimonas_sp.AAC.1
MKAFYHVPVAFLELGGACRPLYLATSAVASGCPFSESIWALVFGPALHGVDEFFEGIQRGTATACAGDPGCVLAQLQDIEGFYSHLHAIALYAGLHLLPRKCVLVPVWAIASSDLISGIQAALGSVYADWASFE